MSNCKKEIPNRLIPGVMYPEKPIEVEAHRRGYHRACKILKEKEISFSEFETWFEDYRTEREGTQIKLTRPTDYVLKCLLREFVICKRGGDEDD